MKRLWFRCELDHQPEDDRPPTWIVHAMDDGEVVTGAVGRCPLGAMVRAIGFVRMRIANGFVFKAEKPPRVKVSRVAESVPSLFAPTTDSEQRSLK